MAQQIRYLFREVPLQSLPFDITMVKSIIPIPFVDWDKHLRNGCSSHPIVFSAVMHESPQCLMISRVVPQRLYDSPIHDLLESDLDHVITPPRSGLGSGFL